MKITKAQLKQIIQEEIEAVDEGFLDKVKGMFGGGKEAEPEYGSQERSEGSDWETVRDEILGPYVEGLLGDMYKQPFPEAFFSGENSDIIKKHFPKHPTREQIKQGYEEYIKSKNLDPANPAVLEHYVEKVVIPQQVAGLSERYPSIYDALTSQFGISPDPTHAENYGTWAVNNYSPVHSSDAQAHAILKKKYKNAKAEARAAAAQARSDKEVEDYERRTGEKYGSSGRFNYEKNIGYAGRQYEWSSFGEDKMIFENWRKFSR